MKKRTFFALALVAFLSLFTVSVEAMELMDTKPSFRSYKYHRRMKSMGQTKVLTREEIQERARMKLKDDARTQKNASKLWKLRGIGLVKPNKKGGRSSLRSRRSLGSFVSKKDITMRRKQKSEGRRRVGTGNYRDTMTKRNFFRKVNRDTSRDAVERRRSYRLPFTLRRNRKRDLQLGDE